MMRLKQPWITTNVCLRIDMASSKYRAVSRRSDLVLGLSTVCSFFFFAFISSLESALAYSIVFGVFLSIIQTKWNRSDPRFWIIITILAVVHIVILSAIRVPELRFGLMSLPFALIDGFAMWGLINWIERRFPNANDVGSDK